jgi:hypothetical protein
VSAWVCENGYGAVLLGIVAGILSLGFQFLMVDVNSQRPQAAAL